MMKWTTFFEKALSVWIKNVYVWEEMFSDGEFIDYVMLFKHPESKSRDRTSYEKDSLAIVAFLSEQVLS